ncbi:DnrO protein [Dyella solisilvae]|uniref:DnrO protein n=1 Tax=Dyella solisilvae TaxID=1920168 RepID=A0A370KDJ7_9GAMM|nr:DnrO protein [Dyella solisilvae]
MNRVSALLVGALAIAAPLYAAPQHDHAAHAASDSQQAPAPSPRWATDASLRDGMGRIHQALDELRHYEMGHMNETMAQDRAGLILDAGAYIFANCKLPPQQDEVLHGMLVPLLAAAQKLKDHPQDMAQVAAMRKAVADYPRYFDDPGWTQDAVPAHPAHN